MHYKHNSEVLKLVKKLLNASSSEEKNKIYAETPKEIFSAMQDSVSTFYKDDLHCLDRFTRNY